MCNADYGIAVAKKKSCTGYAHVDGLRVLRYANVDCSVVTRSRRDPSYCDGGRTENQSPSLQLFAPNDSIGTKQLKNSDYIYVKNDARNVLI